MAKIKRKAKKVWKSTVKVLGAIRKGLKSKEAKEYRHAARETAGGLNEWFK